MITVSSEQRAAVERTGQDVCVVAGPGSGKTRVLTERFAWLVEERGMDPSRILAVTFTEKAATEIKARLIARFSGPDLRESIERAWVTTIDGFCARLLREHAITAGLPPDFLVLEAGAAERMLRIAAEEALDELYGERPAEIRELLTALDLSTQDDGPHPDLAASLIEIYDRMRVSGVDEIHTAPPQTDAFAQAIALANRVLRDATPATTANIRVAITAARDWALQFRDLPRAPITQRHVESLAAFRVNLGHAGKGTDRQEALRLLKNEVLPKLEAQWIGAWYEGLHDLLREAIRRIAASYAAKKRAETAVDFADLETFAVKLLEEDRELLARVSNSFLQILMDELQDTNPLQWRLMNLIRNQRAGVFFGVGDINQSIYGFRYAEPRVFREYRTEIESRGGTIDELRENHRSRKAILEAVTRTLTAAPGIEPRELLPRREHFDREGTSTPRPLLSRDREGADHARSPAVELLIGQGDNCEEIEAAMVAQRIRELTDSGECNLGDIAVLVRALGSTKAFEKAFDRADIPFLVSGGRTFLEARETKDVLAFLATLVNPLDDIALITVLRGPLVSMADEEIYRIGREGWLALFERRFGTIRKRAGFLRPDLLIAKALDETGYLAQLPERAQTNVEKLLAWIRREHRRRPRALAELLEDLEALRQIQSEAEAPPPDAAGAVRIMTIHAAKGLEFPVVFVSALHRGTDNRAPVIAFSPDHGLGAKWRNPVTGKGQSDFAHKLSKAEIAASEEAEEHRLLYVAMTRAEDRLILSWAERKRASAWQTLVQRAVADRTAVSELPLLPQPRQASEQSSAREEILSPPTVSGQYDSTVSPTDVALFTTCPRKYYLARYLSQPEVGQAPGQRRAPGPPLQELKEAAREAAGQGPVPQELGTLVHRSLAGETLDHAEALQLADQFRSSALGRRASQATRIEREFDFAMEIDDVILSGQIDLWFEEAGELIVVDYKTDRDESASQAYALQLRLYALALERHTGKLPDRTVLYYLRTNNAIAIGLSDSEMQEAKNAVRELREGQEKVSFPLTTGDHCFRCAYYKGLCPATVNEPSSASPPS